MKPVLVVDGQMGQTITALGAVRALGVAGRTVHLATAQPLSVAAASRYCSRSVPIPLGDDPAEFAEAVTALHESGSYDAVLLTSDAAILALGWSGAALVDKSEVALRAKAAGFTPAEDRTFASGAELVEQAGSLQFPVVVKPEAKDGYRGGADGKRDNPAVFRADSVRDLQTVADYESPVVTQTWLEGRMDGVSGVFWDGRLRAVMHQTYRRFWPYPCGIGTYSISTEPRMEIEERLPVVLEGHNGVFNIQVIGDSLLDINPRVYGSIFMAARYGANFPDIAARLTTGEDIAPRGPIRVRAGVHYRFVEGDVRSLLAQRRQGELSTPAVLAALRPRRDTVHPDFSLSDPMPTLARVRHALARRRGQAAR